MKIKQRQGHSVRYGGAGLQTDTPRSRLHGIALVSAAYLFFAVLIACAKWLGQRLPVVEVVWVRMAVHVAISAVVLWPQIGARLIRTSQPGWQLARATMMVVMTLCNFTAVQFIPLDVNSAILFLTPLLVAMFGAWLLAERLDGGRWLAVLVGFIGVLIILRPGTDGFHLAMLLTLFAAILYALFNLLTRKLARDDSPSATQFLSTLGGVVILAPLAWWQWQWPVSLLDWGVILLRARIGHHAVHVHADRVRDDQWQPGIWRHTRSGRLPGHRGCCGQRAVPAEPRATGSHAKPFRRMNRAAGPAGTGTSPRHHPRHSPPHRPPGNDSALQGQASLQHRLYERHPSPGSGPW